MPMPGSRIAKKSHNERKKFLQRKKDAKAQKKAGEDKTAVEVKALKAQKRVKKGNAKTTRSIRTSATFRRPTTLKLERNPKYPRSSQYKGSKLDSYSIIRFPLTTEAAMSQVEHENKLVLICDTRANKPQIRSAVEDLYKVKVVKVNTLIRPDGKKKAYVKLSADHSAIDVASNIGLL